MARLIYQQGFQGGRIAELEYDSGDSLADIRAKLPIPEALRPRVAVAVNGDAAPEDYRPEPGEHVLFYLLPAGGESGGKGVLSTVAMLGLTLAAAGAPGAAFAGAIGLGESVAVGRALLMMGGSLVLGLAQNALIKPPPQADQPGGDPFFRFTGSRNQLAPWAWFPRVYGRHRLYPYLLAPPNITIEGAEQYIHLLFDFGYGPLQLSDLKIGETPLDSYENVDYHEYPEFDGSQELRFFQSRTDYTQVGAALLQSQPVERSTSLETRRANINLSFPAGLYSISKKGKASYAGVSLLIETSPAGADTWEPIPAYTLDNAVLEDTFTAQLKLSSTHSGRQERRYKTIPGATQVFTLTATRNNYYSAPGPGQRIRWQVPKLGWVAGTVAAVSGTQITMTMDNPFPVIDYGTVETVGVAYEPARYCFGVYINTPGIVVMRGEKRLPFDASIQFDLPGPGQYDIRVTRTTPDYPLTSSVISAVDWQSLISHVGTNKDLFKPEKPHHVLELRLRATDQISGTVDTFNAIAESLLHTWSGGVKSAEPVPTRNAAWVFVDVLLGSANKRPTTEARIDWPAIEAWAAANDAALANDDPDAPAYECNLVVQGDTTIRDLLNVVCATSRASPGRRDGKYTVVLDDTTPAPVQLITPKNSYGLQASIGYINPPHALKVQFTDARLGYQPGVAVVYNDGYDKTNATIFEQLNLPGVTAYEQAWRLGRYWLAAGILRRERVTVSMDVENLVATRGDLVMLATDVLKAGGLPRRVTAIAGDQVTLDESVAGSNAVRLRGESAVIPVTVISPQVVQLPAGEAAALVVGDLLEYGVSNVIKAPYLVESVTPGPDLSASLTLLEFRGEVGQAADGAIPPRPVIPGTDPVTGLPEPPRSVRVEYVYTTENRIKYVQPILRWQAPAKPPSRYRITAQNGAWLASVTQNYYALPRRNISDLAEAFTREFFVASQIDQIGFSAPVGVVVTYAPNVSPPADVVGFSLNAQTETLLMSWLQNPDADLAGYQIRYSADPAATWGNATVLIDDISFAETATFSPLRSGWYFIKAYNTSEVYSLNAAARFVQADDLEGLKILQTLNFAPFDSGTYDDTTEISGELHLDEGEAAGAYYPVDSLALTEKTRIRLLADIKTRGQLAGIMLADPWFEPLSTAAPLAGPDAAGAENKVDAQIYFRYDTGGGAMSPYERLTVADVFADTGGVEFAVMLSTIDLQFYPIVTAAGVEVYTVERKEAGYGVAVPAGGLAVSYSRPFADRPAVQINLVDSAAQEYATVEGSTKTGFTVKVYNQAGTAIASTIDWTATGYGETD